MMTAIFFSRQKYSQKSWWDTLNAVLTSLPISLPDVHNPSRIFHFSKNIVLLIAKPWAGGIQLWQTSKIFPRNRGIYRQNNKMINSSRQQAKSFLLTVQTLWQNLIIFFPEVCFAKYSSGQISFMFRNPAEKKIFRSANSLHSWSKNKFWENYSSIKKTSSQNYLLDTYNVVPTILQENLY